jgi:hypothetical protein
MRCRGRLLSEERRSRAIVLLEDRFRVSQRRAYRLTGQHRKTQGRPVQLADIKEQKLKGVPGAGPGQCALAPACIPAAEAL